MIGDHVKETVPGVIGNCAVGGAAFVAWLTADGLPVLHALSVVAGTIAGVGTAGYYFAMWRKARRAEAERREWRRKRRRK